MTKTTETIIKQLNTCFTSWARSEYNCKDYGCDDYCRCGSIVGLEVSFMPQALSNLDRLDLWFYSEYISDYKINDDYHEFTAEGDYYGEILTSSTINFDGLIRHLMLVDTWTDAQKIEYLLNKQYGSLTPIKNVKRWTVQKIHPSKITVSNDNHLAKCIKKNKDGYNLLEIVGIVIKEGGSFRLIDGYNRLSRVLFKNKDVWFIVGHTA